jgi:hypothetical protein
MVCLRYSVGVSLNPNVKIPKVQTLLDPPKFDSLPDSVRPISDAIARSFVITHHYLHRGATCPVLNLGVCIGHQIMGVLIFSNPVARMEDQVHTFELRRMCLLDSPKNSESRALAMAEKYIRLNFPQITRLISYADTDKHEGKIYLAANWKVVENYHYGGRRDGWGSCRKSFIDCGGVKVKYEKLIKPIEDNRKRRKEPDVTSFVGDVNENIV